MALVEQIDIKNFKSHTSFQSKILSKDVVVYGNNGIGKTNLLESLSFFSNSKGMRGNKLENFFQKKKWDTKQILKSRLLVKAERLFHQYLLWIN